jgi:2-polyprenyl-3-methyl-5-hydroxy-6-metoxy-1,4-benzoquinol methylase
MSYKYREVFYKDYFSSQSGRRDQVEQLELLKISSGKLTYEILPLLPKDRSLRILDIGCGFGSFIHVLKENGYQHIVGIDVSEQQVAVAHELGLNEVIKYDLINYLTENVNAFDVITGIDIIEHFSKDELVSVLNLVKNSLKENGMAIFRTPNMDSPFTTIFAYGDFTHENHLNSSSAEQVGLAMGFRNVSVTSSYMGSSNPLKELFRKLIWGCVMIQIKLQIFASGRTSKGIIFTPNLIICYRK